MALRSLQGATIDGSHIKIEFSKGDNTTSGAPLEEEYSPYYAEQQFVERERELRYRSPEKSFGKLEQSKDTEPSSELWIGFPASLNVDEASLRKAFSPFGEITKIITYPGRSYAFVQFRSVVAACRAKENLQGKLFNNPRVRICFSRNESRSGKVEAGSISNVHSPRYTSAFDSEFHGRSPRYTSAFDSEFHGRDAPFLREKDMESPLDEFRARYGLSKLASDADYEFSGRNSSLRSGVRLEPSFSGNYENVRLPSLGPDSTAREDRFEHRRHDSVLESGIRYDDIPFKRPRRSELMEEPWHSDPTVLPSYNKLESDDNREKELPEYPFAEFEPGNTSTLKYNYGLSKRSSYFGSPKSVPPIDDRGKSEFPWNRALPPNFAANDSWRSKESAPAAGSETLGVPRPLRNAVPESNQVISKEAWNWEGIIAKSGAPVCRAKCFPVGKVLNFMLPELLDCTARTGLDVLENHYNQASSSWVVFFVPGSDADMGSYNEFKHYLGEKQRAAVAKLSDKITLFFVPPSEFSKKVLRVPGNVSISGVVIKFDDAPENFRVPHGQSQSEVLLVNQPPSTRQPNAGIGFHDSVGGIASPDVRSDYQFPNSFTSSSVSCSLPSDLAPSRNPENTTNGVAFNQRQWTPDFHADSSDDHKQQQPSTLPSNLQGNSKFNTANPASLSQSMFLKMSDMADTSSYTDHKYGNRAFSGDVTPQTASNLSLPSIRLPVQQEPHQDSSYHQQPSMQLPLQPEQLTQLATLLAKQKQPENESGPSYSRHDSIHPGLASNSTSHTPNTAPKAMSSLSVAPVPESAVRNVVPGSSSRLHAAPSTVPSSGNLVAPPGFTPSQQYTPQISHGQMAQQHVSNLNAGHPQTSQVQQALQHVSNLNAGHPDHLGQPRTQQAPAGNQEEPEADPQKRLQATLQLAAALLQQIQQQSKTSGQQ